MAEPHHGLIDGQEYNLKIGSSFRQRQKDNFYHTVRYDFKPASVDSSKSSQLAVGENNDITVTVPNVQESESTVFKGSKRPCTKECILIIDKSTGEVTLERLASNIQLKKIRSTGSSLAVPKTIPPPSQVISKVSTKPSVHKQRALNSKAETSTVSASAKSKEDNTESLVSLPPRIDQPIIATKPLSRDRMVASSSSQGSDSDSSSSGSDSDSDSDQDDQEAEEQAKALDEALRQETTSKGSEINLIEEDLNLSGSSDSDSD
eukprot:gene20590-22621_t